MNHFIHSFWFYLLHSHSAAFTCCLEIPTSWQPESLVSNQTNRYFQFFLNPETRLWFRITCFWSLFPPALTFLSWFWRYFETWHKRLKPSEAVTFLSLWISLHIRKVLNTKFSLKKFLFATKFHHFITQNCLLNTSACVHLKQIKVS